MNTPGFLELLAVNVLNLYRVLMISRDDSIPLVKRLRQEVQSPRPGDIILELNGGERPHAERISLLEQVIAKEHGTDLMVIQTLTGEYKVVANAVIIKIPREIIGVQ
ncbi:MAG: hypothetical protein KC413_24035 [Anaerolineales bacterium]|nr:hypothetical protein [Anaerolineales bacterium]